MAPALARVIRRTIPRSSTPFTSFSRHNCAAAGFSTSTRRTGKGDGGDIGADRKHLLDKEEGSSNVQSDASDGAHKDRASGAGSSQATSEKDDQNHNKQAKKDHPEAPEPVIGMNDERGGKGH